MVAFLATMGVVIGSVAVTILMATIGGALEELWERSKR